MTYDLWAKAERTPWVLLVPGLRGQAAADELIRRQDRVRRAGYGTKFRLVPAGSGPPDL